VRTYLSLALESIAAARGLLDARKDALAKGDTFVATQLLCMAMLMRDSAVAALACDKKAGLQAAMRAQALLDEKGGAS